MQKKELLSDSYNVLMEAGYISYSEVPSYIIDNINKSFELRKYQIEALNCFIHYKEVYKKRKKPIHLLFNLATGSGKTLLMATNILYLYNQGYRNFIFFVNSTNIIEKTKYNFLDVSSSKYLFSEKIFINGKLIRVNEINCLDEADDTSINIIFTTIQGLHYRINTPTEGSITIEDFKERKVVLLSDESHHLNTVTKRKLSKSEEEEKNSWEYTVNDILNSNIESNILLEYTATAELDNPDVYEKYKDKVIYRYDLSRFREDGYSKEVTVLQSDLGTKERILQAVVISEYRRKVAEKKGLNIKPVILIKSNKIDKSKLIFQNFIKWINELTVEELKGLKTHEKENVINRAFNYFYKENIELYNLLIEIRSNFSEDRCIEVNNKDDSEQKQIIVNTLEDKSNRYRIIFAVDMLNEGWDVLNLFDIIRVDEGRGSKNTTTKEAQLIGRGARYYPFVLDNEQDKYKRKYDEDLENEARILEELYYHSINEPKYISDLRKELREKGIIADDDKRKEVYIKLKDSFKDSDFYKQGFIFTNKQIVSSNEKITSLQDMRIDNNYEYKLRVGITKETHILVEKVDEKAENFDRITVNLIDVGRNIIQKAINKNDFYRFDSLNKYFPHLSSVKEFIDSQNYLGGLKVTFVGKYKNITQIKNEELLESVLYILKTIEGKVRKNYIPYVGTKEFFLTSLQNLKFEKKISFALGGEDKEFGKSMSIADGSLLRMDLSKEHWYAYQENYGTSEEKSFILLMKEFQNKMKENGYESIYLVRNEKLFKLYHFKDDRACEPDFLLWAKKKNQDTYTYFQLFIESKGDNLLENDRWKEELLIEVEENYQAVVSGNLPQAQNINEGTSYGQQTLTGVLDCSYNATGLLIIENANYKIIGLPFYNKANTINNFRKSMNEKLNL